MTALKLTTRPTITRYGRNDSALESLAGADPPVLAAAGIVAAARALCAPDMRITGSTGKMHGETPVISPPTRPIAISVNISVGEALSG
ncbi:hypothetical protein MSAS_34540 [Mycobacterium saskatchewanense]|uniref:Uncharacterized protein n=1 Tax=Mycobacterium saskatchewanense TaxID=220927 RepID=A0A7I7LXI5_9MYCO|nr:hypothetical protein MSAS_34540 [Mycobacterium saskatchewanense]